MHLLILLLLPFGLHAGILDHVTPIENKTAGHTIDNVDFIYMINLDSRPEKYARSLEQLKPYGIDPFRFPAIYGKSIPREVINDMGVKYAPWMDKEMKGCFFPLNPHLGPHDEVMYKEGRSYFCYRLHFGAIGCAMSHLSVLMDAYLSGYETIWVMEDDIEIVQDPHLISSRIEELDALVGKEGWDVLFTDRDTRNAKGEYIPCTAPGIRPDIHPKDLKPYALNKKVSETFRQIGARFGSYSVILRRSGIEKILNYYAEHQMFWGYDIENFMPEGIRFFTVLDPIVVSFTDAPSDNNGREKSP
jgi:GR25 family glycosyltransferase involved in LPS biosynthesis